MRIISGSLGGRRLRTPTGRGTRPTAERVREAIFNVLAHAPQLAGPLPGATVLDLFAGSGAMALEALSRGAAGAVLVDRAVASVQAIRENLDTLGVGDRAEVLGLDATRALARLAAQGRCFGLVFIDPPYDRGEARAEVLTELVARGLLADGAVVVVEGPPGASGPVPPGLSEVDPRPWGPAEVVFYRRGAV